MLVEFKPNQTYIPCPKCGEPWKIPTLGGIYTGGNHCECKKCHYIFQTKLKK